MRTGAEAPAYQNRPYGTGQLASRRDASSQAGVSTPDWVSDWTPDCDYFTAIFADPLAPVATSVTLTVHTPGGSLYAHGRLCVMSAALRVR